VGQEELGASHVTLPLIYRSVGGVHNHVAADENVRMAVKPEVMPKVWDLSFDEAQVALKSPDLTSQSSGCSPKSYRRAHL
jgi:hypothetical protein